MKLFAAKSKTRPRYRAGAVIYPRSSERAFGGSGNFLKTRSYKLPVGMTASSHHQVEFAAVNSY